MSDLKISDFPEIFTPTAAAEVPLALAGLNKKIGIDNFLAGKADLVHAHTAADVGLGNVANLSPANLPVSAAQAVINALKADLVGGKVPFSQIPAIAITDYLGAVANQATMLGLIGERGDWCIRTDTSTVWVLNADTPALLVSWTELPNGVGALVPDGDKGDIVVSSSGTVWTVDIDTNDVPDTVNSRYVTDADLIILANTSGVNTGDDKTAITGLLKGDGTDVLLAIAGTDYAAAADATKRYSTNIGDGILTVITVPHTFGTADMSSTVREIATNKIKIIETEITSTNVIYTFYTIPTLNQYRITLLA